MNLDLRRIYYYAICLVALFVLGWGIVDTISSTVTIATSQNLSLPQAPEASDAVSDQYFQRRIHYDRIADGLARAVVGGFVLLYFKKKIDQLEGGA